MAFGNHYSTTPTPLSRKEQGTKKEPPPGQLPLIIRMRGRRKLLPPDILNRIQIGSAYEKTIYLNTITECKADFVHKSFLRLHIL